MYYKTEHLKSRKAEPLGDSKMEIRNSLREAHQFTALTVTVGHVKWLSEILYHWEILEL